MGSFPSKKISDQQNTHAACPTATLTPDQNTNYYYYFTTFYFILYFCKNSEPHRILFGVIQIPLQFV